jgi:hypothetical protein
MSYTLATAAKATGLNKSTILRAIKSGHVTGKKDEFGEWRVERADLHRVFPPVAELAPAAMQRGYVQGPSKRRSKPSSGGLGLDSENSSTRCATSAPGANRRKSHNGISPTGQSSARGGGA